jgi:hypothetical protein
LDSVIATRLGPFNRVHRWLDRALGIEQARLRAEPAIAALPASLMIASRRKRAEFLSQMNHRLGLDHLRPMDAADVQADDLPDLDFRRDVDRSVLPLMLREASRGGLTLCFIRVQRRPTANRPPPQSPALRRYIDALRSYLAERGALFHDDTGDPLLTLDLYADGDHLTRQARQLYTENLYNRLRPHFQ